VFIWNCDRTEAPEVTGKEPAKEKSGLSSLTESLSNVFGGGESKEKEKPRFSMTAADLLPRIRRGFGNEEKQDETVVSVGWKAVVRSRREKEELLR
jgi:hypothetical protein